MLWGSSLPCRLRGAVGIIFCCPPLPLRKQGMYLLLRTGHREKAGARKKCVLSSFPSKENLLLTHLLGKNKKQKQMKGTRKKELPPLDFLLPLEPH